MINNDLIHSTSKSIGYIKVLLHKKRVLTQYDGPSNLELAGSIILSDLHIRIILKSC